MKSKFTDLVENEIQKLKSVKVSFGLQVKFSIERSGETQYMEHYFKENEPQVFNRNDEEQNYGHFKFSIFLSLCYIRQVKILFMFTVLQCMEHIMKAPFLKL